MTTAREYAEQQKKYDEHISKQRSKKKTVSERNIYNDDGSYTKVLTKGEDVTVSKVSSSGKTTESQKYKASQNLSAGQVSIQDKNIKSYEQQEAEKRKREEENLRQIAANADPNNIFKKKTQSSAYEQTFQKVKSNNETVGYRDTAAKQTITSREQAQRDVNYIVSGKSKDVNKKSVAPVVQDNSKVNKDDPNYFKASKINASEKVGIIKSSLGFIETAVSRFVSRGNASSFTELGMDQTKEISAIGNYIKSFPQKAKDARTAFYNLNFGKSLDVAKETLIGEPMQGLSHLETEKDINFGNFKAEGADKTIGEYWKDKQSTNKESLVNEFRSGAVPSVFESSETKQSNNNYETNSYSPTNDFVYQDSHNKDNDSLFNKVLFQEHALGQKGGNIIRYGVGSGVSTIASAAINEPLTTAAKVSTFVYGVSLAGKGASGLSYLATHNPVVQTLVAKATPEIIYAGLSIKNVLAQDSKEAKYAAIVEDATLGAVFFGGAKIIDKVSDASRALGKTYVDPTDLFDESVLKGNKNFPTAKNVDDTLNKFKRAQDDANKLIVQHSGSSPLSDDTIGAGPMGSKNMEDAGLFVTPAGEGSPHFLGVGGYDNKPVDVEFSLFPNPSKPTVVRVSDIDDIKRLPEELIQKVGFEESNIYLQDQAGSGNIFLTKRSEVGLRGLQGKGAGTSEIEAIIPKGSELKSKGSSQYTVHQNRIVPIEDYSLTKNKVSDNIFESTVKEISNKASELSSYLSQNKIKVQTGIPFVGAFTPESYSEPVDVVSSSSPINQTSNVNPVLSEPVYSSKSSTISESPSSFVSESSIQPSEVILSPVSSDAGSSSSDPVVSLSEPMVSQSSSPLSSLPSSISYAQSSFKPSSISRSSMRIVDISNIKKNFAAPRPKAGNVSRTNRSLFNVQVRRNNMFKTVFSIDDLKQAAFFGKGRVQNTAAASMRILDAKTGAPVDFGLNLLGKDFRKSTKEEGVFIEKRDRRIKSAGELSEITYKGIATNRVKGLIKKIKWR